MGMLPQGLARRAEVLPLPIAGPLRRADVATSKAGAYVPLVQAAEATLALLAAVVLRDAGAEGLAPGLLKPDHAAHASMGLWRQTLEGVAHKLKRPTLPELTALRADAGRWGVFNSAVGILVDARNHFAHPIKAVDAVLAERELPRCAEALRSVLAMLPALEQVTLVRVVARGPTDGRLQVVPLNGPHATRSPQWVTWADPPGPATVLLLDTARGRWRDLAPLYRWADDQLWAYTRTVRDGDGWQAHWADCVQSKDGAPTQAPGPGWLARRLAERAPGGDARLSTTDAVALSGGQTAVHLQSDTLVAAALEATETPAAIAAPPAGSPPRGRHAPLIIATLAGLVGVTAWLALRDPAPGTAGPRVSAPAAPTVGSASAGGRLPALNLKAPAPLTLIKPPPPAVAAAASTPALRLALSSPVDVVRRVLDRPRAHGGEHFLDKPCADPSLVAPGAARPQLREAARLADRALVIETGPRGERWWGLSLDGGRWRISHEAVPARSSACGRELARRFGRPLPR